MNPRITNDRTVKINTEPKDLERILVEKPRVPKPEVSSSLFGSPLKIDTSSSACQFSLKISSMFKYGMLKLAMIKILSIIIDAFAGNYIASRGRYIIIYKPFTMHQI